MGIQIYENSKIFNASGRFGQYIFVDNDNDVVFVRITKYQPSFGSKQNWGVLSWIGNINNVGFNLGFIRVKSTGLQVLGMQMMTFHPNTRSDGESDQFYDDYHPILDAIQDLSQSYNQTNKIIGIEA